MTDAQLWLKEWLDKNYPKEERNKVNVLFTKGSNLEGELVIKDFSSLERVICDSNDNLTRIELINLPQLNYFSANKCRLNNLVVDNCPKINYLNVGNNLLHDTGFLNNLNFKELTYLSIHSNNFESQSLEFLSKFDNLEELYIDNSDAKKFTENKYNHFYGSLEPLISMSKLKELSINNTDVRDGLEYLPTSLEKIYCNASIKKDAGCKKIIEGLKNYQKKDGKGIFYAYQNWRKSNLSYVLSALGKNVQWWLNFITK